MKAYVNYFNEIKLNLIKKNKYFYMLNTKKSKTIVTLLVRYNYIIGYEVKVGIKFSFLKVYLNNKSNYNRIKNICKTSHLLTVKYFFLKKYTYKYARSTYILSTNKGFIDIVEAEKNRIGGIIMFKIN